MTEARIRQALKASNRERRLLRSALEVSQSQAAGAMRDYREVRDELNRLKAGERWKSSAQRLFEQVAGVGK